YALVMRYVRRIEKDPTKSLNYNGSNSGEVLGSIGNIGGKDLNADSLPDFSTRDAINIGATLLTIVAILFGAVKLSWSINQISTVFLILSVFLGLYNGHGINGTTDLFVKGCSTMVGAAFTVGFANGISVVLGDGKILSTIIYYLSLPMGKLGANASTAVMYLANMVINIFLPSGSGQAAAVMPIMVPIADIVGITRQVAVQAFQFGDGFSNCITPAAAALMAGLGMAGVPSSKYIKWYLPFFLLQSGFAIVSLIILQTIGWTGI
ncbi:MAG: TIGR00366 family protein, partial [Euryarchaeota archaeon]|nr:TIGR00366 family protein [Euryarchaeota archaeon]